MTPLSPLLQNTFYIGLAALTLLTGAFFYKVATVLLLYLTVWGLAAGGFSPSFSLFRHPLFWGTILFLLYGGITSFFSLSPAWSLKTEAGIAGILACLWVRYQAPFTPFSPPKIQHFFIVLFSVTLVVLIEEVTTQGAGHRFLIRLLQKTPPDRICLKQAAALMALAVFPIAAFLTHQKKRLFAAGLMAAVLWVCYTVYAQAAFLAVVGGCCVFLMCHFRPLWGVYGGTWGSFFLILATPFLKLYAFPTVFFQAYLPENSSLYQRFLIWDFAIDRIFEKPFWGWGWGVCRFIPGAQEKLFENMAGIPVHTHNNSLQIWLELGGVGAFFVASLVSFLFWQLRLFTNNPLYVSTYGALLGAIFVINSSSYSAWHLWWLSWVGLICFLPRFLLTD